MNKALKNYIQYKQIYKEFAAYRSFYAYYYDIYLKV